MARPRTIEPRIPAPEAGDGFALFDRVSLRLPQRFRNERIAPSGTAGTIVEVLAAGKKYIVELDEPDPILLDVAHSNLVKTC